MNRFRPFLLIAGLLLAFAASAAEVQGLYEATVPVADQQSASRLQAMRLGLAQVLVRVTGYGGAAQDPVLADMLGDASHYVQQYRYQTPPASPAATAAASPSGATVAPSSSGAAATPPLQLWMAFDPASIDQALRARHQPVWGRARPLVLVWLAVDDGSGNRHLVAAADGSDESQALLDEAKLRGLPLRLPLWDLQDQSKVAVADVWGGFQSTLLAASARYNPQAVLIGRLFRDPSGMWHAAWTLRVGQDSTTWNNDGPTPAEVLKAGVDATADSLSLRFAQVGDVGAGSSLVLNVTGINKLADYTRVLYYLKAINGVTDVQVAEVQPGSVTYRLALHVEPDGIIRTIGFGNTLAAVSSNQAPQAGTATIPGQTPEIGTAATSGQTPETGTMTTSVQAPEAGTEATSNQAPQAGAQQTEFFYRLLR